MTTYLQEQSFYEDLYDLHTIEECIDWFNKLKNGMEKHRAEFVPEPPHHTDFDHEVLKACSYTVNTLKITRYRHRKQSVAEWMEKDRKRQEVFDSAIPDDPQCDKCQNLMEVIDKYMQEPLNKEPKVYFMYQCYKCKFKKIIYADGSPWDFVPPVCPKCKGKLEDKYSRKGDVLKTTTSCVSCSYKSVEVIDFKKNNAEREKEAKRRKYLLDTYRSEFCLDDVEGPKAVSNLDGIIRIVDEWKAQEKKEKDPVFQKSKQLKQIKLNQLKEILKNAIEKDGYSDLQFKQPDMGKYVTIEFTVTESNNDRSEYHSTHTLSKLIKTALKATNWRLMSEGIHYRIGILSGRLKAYETEEDLISLVK